MDPANVRETVSKSLINHNNLNYSWILPGTANQISITFNNNDDWMFLNIEANGNSFMYDENWSEYNEANSIVETFYLPFLQKQIK